MYLEPQFRSLKNETGTLYYMFLLFFFIMPLIYPPVIKCGKGQATFIDDFLSKNFHLWVISQPGLVRRIACWTVSSRWSPDLSWGFRRGTCEGRVAVVSAWALWEWPTKAWRCWEPWNLPFLRINGHKPNHNQLEFLGPWKTIVHFKGG